MRVKSVLDTEELRKLASEYEFRGWTIIWQTKTRFEARSKGKLKAVAEVRY